MCTHVSSYKKTKVSNRTVFKIKYIITNIKINIFTKANSTNTFRNTCTRTQ